ncbi:PREDICTED: RNA polymerase II elongation factor Ell isoform X1 [Trachymyrmex septentrionalis]|uniref:RNA polymerase II elongation factor Ell isoform X1 n=2 Tax=Trachymyrmex septentrionalis TaxID=34720 RepID=UPI00084EF508|nr:PREDICTED: RNA polymerase II elongation factor Ell isoform X1 [Trachymyrmex septentrionalis]XP_018339358.1 PREDICTED: RNA polymerase II elongation factor Ell isoform X1 [Trachymyrmex septentrionalis]
MGDEEMALVPDVQYGLSSHGNFDERKSLVFVKLTDSSQRAIREYLKIKHKIGEKPNIQFLGNDGRLSIPSINGVARFTFSISSSQDMEGSQGGFELAQQTGPKSLESLGAIPYKMRIQANDDVYETTRHRMAVVEENNKNKCTRVIKANGPDIGRKVKVKGTGRTIPPPSSYARHRESTMSIPTSGNSQPKASINKPIANSSSNSNSSNHLSAAHNQEKKPVSDIMRRPLKERLIHLLALRPYKKPELYERIKKEGLRERERPIMQTLLKQVAYMRDNTYHLYRHIWNDVLEDWPFYTEQERTMLRRRKPQNLTPPGSSDGGSSGSGQSPNSIHAGSPPAITAPPPNLVSNKRPGYYQGNDGLPTKKPRISHYKKPEPISFIPAGERLSGSSSYNNNNSGVSATAGGDRIVDRTTSVNSGCGNSNSGDGSNSNNGGSGFDGWETRRQLQSERSSSNRVDYRAERTANSSLYYGVLERTANSSDVLRGTGNVYSEVSAITAVPNDSNRSSCLTPLSPDDSERGNHHPNGDRHDGGVIIANEIASNVIEHTDRRDRSDRSRGAREERNREREFRNRSSTTSYAGIYGETSSAPTYADNAIGTTAISLPTDGFERLGSTGQYVDYRTEYTTISNPEQKRRYKEEFNANYDEYRRLHSQVLVTANRFTHLYTLLQDQKKSGNMIESEETKEQIYREYKETKQNPVYQQMKERFDYLHNKLSHIKRLILEYDSENAAGRMPIPNTTDNGIISNSMNIGSNNIGGIDHRHY